MQGKGGIYKIENIRNSKVYIGQSNNIEERWKQHIKTLKGNSNHNRALQEDCNKFGLNVFKFSVLEYCDDEVVRLESEDFYIKQYGGAKCDMIYNLRDNDNWLSELQVNKLVEYNKSRVYTEDTINKMKNNNSGEHNPMYGRRKYDDEFIAKLRLEYSQCHKYAELSRKYNIDRHIVKRLIQNGVATDPNVKYQKRKYKAKERGIL